MCNIAIVYPMTVWPELQIGFANQDVKNEQKLLAIKHVAST